MYSFSDCTFRAATAEDKELAACWIEADQDHRGRVAPDFFCEQIPGAECMVLCDRWGAPIFFVRIERALRVHMQFAPQGTDEEKARTREALLGGFLWLQQRAQKSGFRELLFQSTVSPLIRFCEKRFGFRTSPNELVCGLASLPATKSQEKTARIEHQTA